MIDGVIAGKLCGRPAVRPATGGKSAVVAKMRAAAGGDAGVPVSVIAFDQEAQAILLELEEGDTAVLQSVLMPKTCTDETGAVKPSLDMMAVSVLTVYHAQAGT